MKKIFTLICLAGLLSFCFLQQANSRDFSIAGTVDHPMLLLNNAEWSQLKKNIRTKKELAYVHDAIIAESDRILSLETMTVHIEGRTMLGTCREALRRILFLSYSYKTTGNKKYSSKCEQQLLELANLPDWNPTHFLDVAENTFAVSIGYDWLFDTLSKKTKDILRNAIYEKGLKPSTVDSYNGWSRGGSNWNQVCNSGIGIGAMTIYDKDPELCEMILKRTVESLPIAMRAYGPDGAYPEGYNYWAYGTTYNVLFIDAIEHLTGADIGLSSIPGFMESARFIEFMTGANRITFNYSDGAEVSELQPQTAMFWYARKTNDLSLLWIEKDYLHEEVKSIMLKNRFLPLFMVWARDINFEDISPPREKMWHGGGETPVAVIRSSWNDGEGFYFGIKGGSPLVSHAHMDIGSFVIDYNGIRWIKDLGVQGYYSLEKHNLNIWNMKDGSDRWKVFRYNNLAHNTLTFDSGLQKADSYAPIIYVENTGDVKKVAFDLSDTYSRYVRKVLRGAELKEDKILLINDDIETGAEERILRWNMVTSVSVEKYDRNTFLLSDNTEKMYVVFDSNIPFELKTWSTTSPNNYDEPNGGSLFMGIECKLPAYSNIKISVSFIPKQFMAQGQ